MGYFFAICGQFINRVCVVIIACFFLLKCLYRRRAAHFLGHLESTMMMTSLIVLSCSGKQLFTRAELWHRIVVSENIWKPLCLQTSFYSKITLTIQNFIMKNIKNDFVLPIQQNPDDSFFSSTSMLLILSLTLKFLLRGNVTGIEIIVSLPAVMAGPHPSILLPS